MNWLWKRFADLSTQELYQSIQLRERVFVVEQNCAYLDCDGYDPQAWHLLGYRDGALLAYMRAFGPGVKYPEACFGRVVTHPEARGSGLGRESTRIGIERIRSSFPGSKIRISAQVYLRRFYEGFGFSHVGVGYLEDGIPHIEMLAD